MTRAFLYALRCTLVRAITNLQSRMRPPEPAEPLLAPEDAARLAREQDRKERRAARTRWYQRRPGQVTIPESLKYYEAVHGTKATVEMLKERARKLENEH